MQRGERLTVQCPAAELEGGGLRLANCNRTTLANLLECDSAVRHRMPDAESESERVVTRSIAHTQTHTHTHTWTITCIILFFEDKKDSVFLGTDLPSRFWKKSFTCRVNRGFGCAVSGDSDVRQPDNRSDQTDASRPGGDYHWAACAPIAREPRDKTVTKLHSTRRHACKPYHHNPQK